MDTSQGALQWRHNGHDGVWKHQPDVCLLNRLFGRRSKQTSKFRVTGICAGNSPGTGEFPAQMASNAENVSIWWRHHVRISKPYLVYDFKDKLLNKYTDPLKRVGSMNFYLGLNFINETHKTTWSKLI